MISFKGKNSEALSDLRAKTNENIVFMQTHTTKPLLGVNTIRGCLEKYLAEVYNNGSNGGATYDSVFTANKWQTRLYLQDGKPMNHDPENLIPTQDLPPIYEENSCLYVFSSSSLYANNCLEFSF